MAYQQQRSPSLGDLVGTGQGVDSGSIFETLGGMASGIGSAVGSAAGAATSGIGSIMDGGLGIDPMAVGTGMPFLADGPIGQGIGALGGLLGGSGGFDPMSVGTGMPFLADGPIGQGIGQGISALGELFSGGSWMAGFGGGSSGGGGAGSSW